MKKAILLAIGTLLVVSPWAAAQSKAEAAKANALYRKGVLAIQQGQPETARACFEGVLRLQPNNPNARYQLQQLGLLEGQMGAKRRELKMQAVTLPKVEFDDLTLPEALDAINAVVKQETDGKFIPNFVLEDPESVFEQRRFTLKLGRVPASVALKYALDSARAVARYDEHAIVIKPLGGAARKAPEVEEEKDPLGSPERRKNADPFAR